ncbi:18708_t:CDS:10, partial [Gigaspora margarita]
MVLQCSRCEKNNFKKTRDLTNHLNRKFKCNQTQIPNPVHPPNSNISRPQSPASSPLSSVVYIHEKEGSKRGQATHLSIEDLANWLANSEIKNNPTIINKKFDLMEESSTYRKGQRKDRRKETPAPKIIDQRDESKKNPKDLDKKYAKDMFKVDGAEYAFSTWFIDTEEHKLEAGMTEERAREILNAIDYSEYLIRVKFIRANIVISDKETKRGFKIIDKYEPIRESKKAGGKYIRGGPNVILTKKTKPGFWVGLDEKFLVRKVSGQSEVEKLDSNAVVYGLYQIQKPDINRLMPIKDGTLNCVAKRVIEHFDQAKREHGLTKIHRQKINDWEKKMRILGARVQDVAKLEKILNTIFNSKKYRSDKYEEIEMVVHNGYAFPRNQHFSRDQMQYQENIINEEKRSILLESLKVVDLAKQVFGANHARSRLANEINEWYPISGKINDDIKRACIEYEHGGPRRMCTMFNRFGHPTHHLVQVAVNGKLPKDNITGFAQVRSFKFAPNIHLVILVWYRKHFACREDLIVGEVIISYQANKNEKCLTHRLVTDEVELDFLIKDCTDAGTFAASMLAYAHINLLEMLQRFEPNEV